MVTNYGYTKYYIVADSAINQSTDFEVDDDASKAKIKSAFSKSLKGKKNNKKILGDFITMIAWPIPQLSMGLLWAPFLLLY